MEKYINLFTDFGFKKIFGTEVNKDLLIDFLNEILKGKEEIKTLTYLKNEHLGNPPWIEKLFLIYTVKILKEKSLLLNCKKFIRNFSKIEVYTILPLLSLNKQNKGKIGIMN